MEFSCICQPTNEPTNKPDKRTPNVHWRTAWSQIRLPIYSNIKQDQQRPDLIVLFDPAHAQVPLIAIRNRLICLGQPPIMLIIYGQEYMGI